MKAKSTTDELRKTGISVVGDMPWGTHLCHFFETKEDLLEILVPFFKAGLENNEFCIWVVSDPLSEEDARNALREALPEADRYLTSGRIEIVAHTLFPSSRQRTSSGEQIEFIPHTDWYLKDGAFIAERVLGGWKQKLTEALAKGYSGLRANGNEAWLTAENWKAFSEYEKTLNENLAGQRMIVLCSYPVTKTGASGLLDVVQSHQYAIARRQGDWEVIESPEPILAKAEIKRLNEQLQRVKGRPREPHPILRYGAAVLSVIAAVFIGRWMQAEYNFEPFVVFLCAMMFSAWFGGIKPGLLALALSILAFHYYFLIPIYLLGVGKEIPRLVTATLTSFFVVLASAAQRTKAESLRRARDFLSGTVQDLKRTNVALRAENAERKRAEDVVRESQQLLRLVVETLPVGVAVTDRAGDIVLINDASKRIWGGSIARGSQRWAETKGYWHDSGKKIDSTNWASVRALSKGETCLNELIDVESYDGQCKIIRNSAVPVRNSKGLIAGALIVNEDVTDRVRAEEALRESEAKLKQAQQLANIGYWERDLIADRIAFSEEAGRIFGLESHGGALSHAQLRNLIRPDNRELEQQALAEALKGSRLFDLESRIVRPDGEIRFVHICDEIVRDESGKPVRMFGAVQDITERKRAEKDLEEANRRLRILSRRRVKVQEEERRHLSRELHDEIGQALTAAKINLQAVREESDGAQSKRISDTIAILEKLLGQVRQISLDLRPSMLDDLGLVPALRSLLDEQGRRASVAVRLSAKNVPEKIDPEIQTTCFRIAQEAITNAVRHASATRIDLHLDRQNGELRLRVRDNGRGFDTESAQAQTAGLGLIGMKERAVLIGAQTRIISAPNKGTTVEVSLPLTSSPEPEGREVEK